MMIPSCQMLGGGGSTILILQTVKTSCCNGLHYFTTSFNRVWIEVLRRFKSCSWCVGGLSWWELPANAPDVRCRRCLYYVSPQVIWRLSAIYRNWKLVVTWKQCSGYEESFGSNTCKQSFTIRVEKGNLHDSSLSESEIFESCFVKETFFHHTIVEVFVPLRKVFFITSLLAEINPNNRS